jgi:23S rRNA pseudouridine1911/1915/1917 synthase
MPRTERGWEITPEELGAWTLFEDSHVLALNKPAHVVCHPSKTGPWTALTGACREYLGIELIHMPVRLDRETSGVVVVAKDRDTGSRLHNAVTRGRFRKVYAAILTGSLHDTTVVEAPIGHDPEAEYTTRQKVSETGRPAVTEFIPLAHGGGYTLVRVVPRSGRMHQIRVHAAHIGHSIVGDKLYGPDQSLMLKFIHEGFTDAHRAALPMERQALHAAELVFLLPPGDLVFRAPLPDDMASFLRDPMGVDPDGVG